MNCAYQLVEVVAFGPNLSKIVAYLLKEVQKVRASEH